MSWIDFYLHRVNSTYQEYFEKKYKDFLQAIPKAEYLVEAGCGIGSTTKALGIGIGFDLFQCESARLNGIAAYTGNLLNIQDYPSCNRSQTVIHSHGVLEHFDHETLCKVIEIQKSIASLCVHYIPSEKYRFGSFGDERLLPKSYWQQFGQVEEFNDGFDLILTVGL